MIGSGRRDHGLTLEAGQIWLVEQSTASPLTGADRAALRCANVVLYDRSLAALVAEALPLGTYAEGLPRHAAASGGAISPRAVTFAAEGWSVVQLVEARPGWRDRLRRSADRLTPLGGDLPVFAIGGGAPAGDRRSDTCLRRLPELIAEFTDNAAPTVIFGPLAACSPAAHSFTANGLAG